MPDKLLLERYLQNLLQGDRENSRAVIEETLQSGIPANSVYTDIVWPIMTTIEKLHRSDRITNSQEHLASRINRTIIDQLQNKLPRHPERQKRIVICCEQSEIHELGAQIMADLFECDGWEVRFLGGGLNNEDILTFVNDYAPDILLIYGTNPKNAPSVRQLIDTIKDVNAWPNMKIMVSGGLFNRAEELWEEIGADLFAANAADALHKACNPQDAKQPVRTINRRKRSRQMREKKQLACQVTTI